MRLKELSVELRDRIVSRHRSGEGYQKMSAALTFPKNTVAIILKLKKFGTTKTLPRAGHLAELSNRGRMALVREVTKKQFLCGDGRTFQRDSGRVARRKKRHMTALLEFAKRHLKILWSDETTIELFSLNAVTMYTESWEASSGSEYM